MIVIGKRKIGLNEPCFIIAEAGVNHNGSLDIAKRLVLEAKKCGVDAVKFQTFVSEDLVTENADMAEYQKKNTGKKSGQLELLKKMGLSYDDFRELKKFCDKNNIIFLSTPHSSIKDVDFLDSIGVPAFKIASGDLTNLPFLEYIGRKGKPMIISTGMGTIDEITEAVNAVKNTGNRDIILLHCTTEYPCEIGNVNLNVMKTIEKEFSLVTGYSDHTDGILVPEMAVAIGAKVVEKHFTLDKNMEGPDHRASLDVCGLAEMVSSIRNVEKILGSDEKKPTKMEIEIAKVTRKSLVAAQDIKKGMAITVEMIAIKRPGTGMKPKELYGIIGRRAKKDIRKNELLSHKMFS